MRQSLVAGNWKMHGSQHQNATLLQEIKAGLSAIIPHVAVAVCPPFIYLPQVSQLLVDSPVQWGAQNICHEETGAFTGEIAVSMVQEFGCRYVIVGHSERRQLYGESDEIVAKKFAIVQQAGLVPILCVGELLSEREAEQTQAVVQRQLDAIIAMQGIDGLKQAVIAYEPVWAIGTGRTATPDQAQAIHAFIRTYLTRYEADIAAQVQILYGGSVKATNAAELFAMPDIDGGLIGGAALEAAAFLAICEAAKQS